MTGAISFVQSSAKLETTGSTYSLLFDFDALADAGRILNCDLLSTFPALQGISASQFRGVLHAAIRPRIIPEGEAGALISLDRSEQIVRAITEAWLLSMPEPKKGEKAERGPKLSSLESWQRCYVTARVQLGLSDAEFGRITPRLLRLLIDEHSQRLEQQKMLFGVVAAAVANFSGHVDRALTPHDFFAPAEARRKTERFNRKKAAEKVRAFFRERMKEQEQRQW